MSPRTRADSLAEVAHETLDLALCMSVDPGWGGQHFLPASLDKLQRRREMLLARIALEVDGGILEQSIASVARAGANVFVTGSGVFAVDDPAQAYAETWPRSSRVRSAPDGQSQPSVLTRRWTSDCPAGGTNLAV